MLVEWMQASLALTIVLWSALYISDYALTLVGARMRPAQAQTMDLQGSYELNPYFANEIDRHRIVSPRFLAALAWTTFLVAFSWLLGRTGPLAAVLFEIVLGALFLTEMAIHVRHLRNIAVFRHKAAQAEMQGRMQYSRRYLFWASALDLFLFALLYLVLFLFIGSAFFLGGVLACAAMGLRHYLARKREPALDVINEPE